MKKIRLDDDLVQGAKRHIKYAGLKINGLLAKGTQVKGSMSFDCPKGKLKLNFIAGKLSASAKHEPLPPLQAFSSTVQELIKALPLNQYTYRIAIIGSVYSAPVLEIVLYTTNDGEAILSLPLEDHHFNLVAAEELRKQQDVSGMIVRYTSKTASVDPDNFGLFTVLEIVYVGSLSAYIRDPKSDLDLDLRLGSHVGH